MFLIATSSFCWLLQGRWYPGSISSITLPCLPQPWKPGTYHYFRKILLLYAACKTIPFYMPFFGCWLPRRVSPIFVSLGRAVLGGGLSLPPCSKPGPWSLGWWGRHRARTAERTGILPSGCLIPLWEKWTCKSHQPNHPWLPLIPTSLSPAQLLLLALLAVIIPQKAYRHTTIQTTNI